MEGFLEHRSGFPRVIGRNRIARPLDQQLASFTERPKWSAKAGSLHVTIT